MKKLPYGLLFHLPYLLMECFYGINKPYNNLAIRQTIPTIAA